MVELSRQEVKYELKKMTKEELIENLYYLIVNEHNQDEWAEILGIKEQ